MPDGGHALSTATSRTSSSRRKGRSPAPPSGRIRPGLAAAGKSQSFKLNKSQASRYVRTNAAASSRDTVQGNTDTGGGSMDDSSSRMKTPDGSPERVRPSDAAAALVDGATSRQPSHQRPPVKRSQSARGLMYGRGEDDDLTIDVRGLTTREMPSTSDIKAPEDSPVNLPYRASGRFAKTRTSTGFLASFTPSPSVGAGDGSKASAIESRLREFAKASPPSTPRRHEKRKKKGRRDSLLFQTLVDVWKPTTPSSEVHKGSAGDAKSPNHDKRVFCARIVLVLAAAMMLVATTTMTVLYVQAKFGGGGGASKGGSGGEKSGEEVMAPAGDLSYKTADGLPSQHNDPEHTAKLHESIIMSHVLDNPHELQDLSSHASAALQWLSDTDPAHKSEGDTLVHERFVLAIFLYATHPDISQAHSRGETNLVSNWTRSDKWMSQASVCDWYGITCETVNSSSAAYGRVVSINLTSNSIGGTLPYALAKGLPHLQELDLSNNDFYGTLPVSIGTHPNLKVLVLSDNIFSGNFPEGNLPHIQQIYARNNDLSGPLPAGFNEMTHLTYLHLSSNRFNGTIPEMAALEHLKELKLDLNELSGPIPAGVGHMSSLECLDLKQNLLRGKIPPFIKNMTLLRVVKLGHNNFVGPLNFDGDYELLELDLQKNTFNGALPSYFGKFARLKRLYLDSNQLSGTIPSEWGLMTDLQVLVLHHNKLRGPIPSSIEGMTVLRDIWVNNNAMTGPVPSALGSLKHLETLYVDNNLFNGTISTTLGGLNKLQAMRLEHNLFSGEVPEEVCKLKASKDLTMLSADCSTGLACSCCTTCM